MNNRYKRLFLGDIANISSGGTPSRSNPAYWNGNIPWVKTAQIQNCIINEEDVEEWITEEGLKKSSAKMISAGTILMAMYGQGKTRGQVSILNCNASINQACAAIELKDGTCRDFVYHSLLGNYESIRNMSNTGSQDNLSAGLIKGIPISLPPLPEQKAIADFLSTWDEAIEKTERLIQAKEKQFGWLLRELISEPRNTQKDAKWKKVKLGDVCKVKKGKQLNVVHMKDDGEYYALNGGIDPSGRTEGWNTEAGTITISEGGNSCGYVKYNTERFWAGGHCYSLINLKENVNKHYLYFYLKMNEPKLMKLRVGSGLPNIQKKDVDKFLITVPSFPEQQKIAEMLSLSRQEITLLKQLAEKYKTQKRGLMQRLLTGAWRIKPDVVKVFEEKKYEG